MATMYSQIKPLSQQANVAGLIKILFLLITVAIQKQYTEAFTTLQQTRNHLSGPSGSEAGARWGIHSGTTETDGPKSRRLQLVIASAQPSASSNDFWSAGEGAVAEKIEIGTLDFLRAPSPPSAASDQTTKPLLLYIPGVDGVGISAYSQFEGFSAAFEFWRVRVRLDGKDRSSFEEFLEAVVSFVVSAGRPTVLLGESFGALVALGAAARLGEMGQEGAAAAVFAVNPATSFRGTAWPKAARALARLPGLPYTAAQLLWLVATLPDAQQVLQTFTGAPVGLGALLGPRRGGGGGGGGGPAAAAAAEGLVRGGLPGAAYRVLSILDKFGAISSRLDQESLSWRVENWLEKGVDYVNPRLNQISVPVVVVAGTGDRLLPSAREARRLADALPDCDVVLVNGGGHVPMLDTRFNMTQTIMEAKCTANLFSDEMKAVSSKKDRRFSKDFVGAFSLPNKEQLKKAYERIKPVEAIFSPQYFSTSPGGETLAGCAGVPDQPPGRPMLFVGNHQLMGTDTGLVVKGLLEGKGILARGLAHPFFWADDDGGVMNNPLIFLDETVRETGSANAAIRDLFVDFGAVPVSPKNYYRLLDRGDAVLLYPGGVREIYHNKGELYQLLWPEKPDFLRMAARFDALIVPFSAIGVSESFGLALDKTELLKIPVVSTRLSAISDSIPSARMDDDGETFVVPIVYPKPPQRMYIKFGQVIDTCDLNPKDAKNVEVTYQKIKAEVTQGIEYLKEARKSDPYNNPVRRFTYERLTGRQAPTFDP